MKIDDSAGNKKPFPKRVSIENTNACNANCTICPIRSRGALMIFAGSVMTVIVYLNKFLIAYFVMRAMGLEVDMLEVIFLQWVLYLVLYFAPTPGASGYAEVSAAAVMGPLLPEAHLGAFVVLWRMFSLYIPMALGGMLLLGQLPRSNQHSRAGELQS